MFCAVLIGSKVVESSRRPMVSTPAASAMPAPTGNPAITPATLILIHLFFIVCSLLIGLDVTLALCNLPCRLWQKRLVRVDIGNGAYQRPRIGLRRMLEHLRRGSLFDD